MTADKWKVVGMVLLAVLAVACGEALLARGMKNAHGEGWAHLRSIITSPYIIIGTSLMAVYFGLYLSALGIADQSFVLPLTAASYPLGTLLARFYLHEHVTPTRWLGIAVITVGVVIVGLGEKEGKKEKEREREGSREKRGISSSVPSTLNPLSSTDHWQVRR